MEIIGVPKGLWMMSRAVKASRASSMANSGASVSIRARSPSASPNAAFCIRVRPPAAADDPVATPMKPPAAR